MKIEEKLMMLRKRNAWSQEELAEKLEVSRQTISKWELGQSIPDTANLTKFATLFGVSVNDLLDENNDLGKNNSKENDSNNENGKNNNKIKISILIIILIVILLGIGVITFNKINKTKNQSKQTTESENFIKDFFSTIFVSWKELKNEVESGMEEEKINPSSLSENLKELQNEVNKAMEEEKFNPSSLYKGDVSGYFMSELLNDVIDANAKNKDNLVTVKYKDYETTDAEKIREIKNSMDVNKIYDVSYEYDDNGDVIKVNIFEGKSINF